MMTPVGRSKIYSGTYARIPYQVSWHFNARKIVQILLGIVLLSFSLRSIAVSTGIASCKMVSKSKFIYQTGSSRNTTHEISASVSLDIRRV